MMNLSKTKAAKALIGISTLLVLANPLLPTTTVYAADQGSSIISIEKPSGWQMEGTKINISVDGSSVKEDFQVVKIEAKIGEEGTWENITDTKYVMVTHNCTIYVKVTDGEGNVYEQNRSLKCFDDEKPTLAASLTDGVLTIQGNDTISGIASITVNGTAYQDLKDGQIKIQLTQKDFTTKKISMTAMDVAGNTSATYSIQNPYYEWAKKQAATEAAPSDNGLTTTTDVTTDGEDQETTAPLPQSVAASEPTSATATVTEQVETAVESNTGETVNTTTETGTKDGKSFYTITTNSGKTFYLVIDNTKSSDNVYLLTEVSEQDLMNFTLSDTVTLPNADTVYATEETEEPETEILEISTEETEEAVMPEDTQSAAGTYLLIGLVILVAGTAGYYFKVYKPKHEFDDEEDEYEEEFEESYEKDDAPETMEAESGETELLDEEDIEDEEE